MGCGGPRNAALEDASGREDLSHYRLESLEGVRDGDRLDAYATLSDGRSPVRLDMQFAVGPRTVLRTGQWTREHNGVPESGTMLAHSVTFLGGQSGPPSIGGRFDLLGPDGSVRYRVTLPVKELARDNSPR